MMVIENNTVEKAISEFKEMSGIRSIVENVDDYEICDFCFDYLGIREIKFIGFGNAFQIRVVRDHDFMSPENVFKHAIYEVSIQYSH